MPIAPVEYLLIGFDGNNFNGEIAPALLELVENETVRILDLLFVTRGEDGGLDAFEYDDLDELEPFRGLSEEYSGLLNDDDIELVAEALAPNQSAIFVVWEDLWAKDFAEAVRASGGFVMKGERIPHEIVVNAIEFDEAGDSTI